MKQIIMSLTVLCTLMLVSFMPDDQPTTVGYKPGDKAMDFSLKNIDGKIVQIIGSHTLFDLVYKNWLVVKLPLRKNYFFLISTSTD